MSTKSSNGVKLTVKWKLDAAMLSRPVDLSSIVTFSKSHPEKFIEDNVLPLIITKLLNEKNTKISNKDTKLDVLNVLANVAKGGQDCVDEVRSALNGVSEWFDEYMVSEYISSTNSSTSVRQEPELHKLMVLLLARCWNYQLKAEDVLELTRGDRVLALSTVVGLLEDGETFTTELRQRQKPKPGQLGQWEHFTVYEKYEKPLLLQICRLLRAFTHPTTYFGTDESDVTLYKVEQFSLEIDHLLEITLQSRFVEKLSNALFGCLFEKSQRDSRRYETVNEHKDSDEKHQDNIHVNLNDCDHIAVTCVQTFLQNLYFFSTKHADAYRTHLLTESQLIPRLVLPYIHHCARDLVPEDIYSQSTTSVVQASCAKFASNSSARQTELLTGLTAAMRTLVIASFQAPNDVDTIRFLHVNNPTIMLLQSDRLCIDGDYLFSLLCMLNINLGIWDKSDHQIMDLQNGYQDQEGDEKSGNENSADTLLNELRYVYELMGQESRAKVSRRVQSSGALPLSRDTRSYTIVKLMLEESEQFVVSEQDSRSNDYNISESVSSSEKYVANNEKIEDNSSSGKENAQYDPSRQLEYKDECSVDPKYSKRRTSRDKRKNRRHQDATEIDSTSIQLTLPNRNPITKQHIITQHIHSSDIPKEFLCAINGHVMRHPVLIRPSGVHIERDTIELWMSSHGSVCPISMMPIDRERDLEPAKELQNRIRRYHIQQTTTKGKTNVNDDLYDF